MRLNWKPQDEADGTGSSQFDALPSGNHKHAALLSSVCIVSETKIQAFTEICKSGCDEFECVPQFL
jgi:hypothetical protein